MRTTIVCCATLLLGGFLSLLLTSTTNSEGECRLTIELVDAASGRPRPGLVHIATREGKLIARGKLLSRGEGMGKSLPIGEWSVITGPSEVSVPRSAVVVQAFYGLETEIVERAIDLTDKSTATLRLRLRSFHDAAAKGYRSGNTHLHLNNLTREAADRYLREIPKADGLDLLFVSYLERAVDDERYITNTYTSKDLSELSRTGVLFAGGEEHRHNLTAYDEGYGHVMFLDLPKLVQPVSIGPGISKKGTDGLPLQVGIDNARSQGATTIWCHNKFGLEDIPNWVTRRLDAQNIYDGGPHGSYDDTYYRYLNIGMKVPFSTGTDWFIYDHSRVYAHLEEPLSTRGWLRSLADGKTYITNGPLMDLRVDKATIGDTVRLSEPGEIVVAGSVVGRHDFKRVELIQNGEVIAQVAAKAEGGHFSAKLNRSLRVDEPCWLALRTPPPPRVRSEVSKDTGKDEFGTALFAHTSPIYVELGGRRVFKQEVVHSLIEEVEAGIRTIQEKALFANDAERQRVLSVHRKALETLRTRLASK